MLLYLAATVLCCFLAVAQVPTVSCSKAVTGGDATLRFVIAAGCLHVPAVLPVNPDQRITSYAMLNDNRDFLLAYYEATTDNQLTPPLHLLRLNKSSGFWNHSVIHRAGIGQMYSEGTCLGSLMEIKRVGPVFYLGTHLTPSAGCELVLSEQLELRRALYGWIVAPFSSGAVVFQESMVHFAPTHPMKLYLYDPRRDSITALYPPVHDVLRAAYIERLKAIPSSDQCGAGINCMGNPDEFESRLASSKGIPEIVVNDSTGTLAFVAQFSAQGFVDLKKTDGSELSEKVIYVYRLFPGPVHYREFPAAELQHMGGSLNELLKPKMLRRLFVVPAITRSSRFPLAPPNRVQSTE